MRTSEAARYARWAAGAAVLIAVAVAVVFGWRWMQGRQARANLPPVVPEPVKQRSSEFSFSKVEGERTLFTIRASQTTQFKQGEKSSLQDVRITIYGRTGKRFDNIHTASCEYEPQTGHIGCPGKVDIDLESAEEAQTQPGQRVIHIQTGGLAFDRETGEAHTDQAVVFDFPYGGGRGTGVTYSTRHATLRLHKDVSVTLTSPGRPGGTTPEPVVLTGASLTYQRDDRTLRLEPPVRVTQGARELTASNVALEFDSALRARRLLVSGNPQLRSTEPGAEVALTAEQFITLFNAQGWAERVIAQGSVRGTVKGSEAEDRIEAARLEVQLESQRNEPRLLTASGNVRLQAQPSRPGEPSRRLETESLRLEIRADGPRGQRRIVRGETLAPGTIEFASPGDTTRVRGARLVAEFNTRNRIQRLAGSSGVEIERRFTEGAAQVSRSREAEVKFGARGDWAEVEQRGEVRFREGEKTVEAERARMVRATDTLTLTGSATVADAITRTTADALTIHQRTGEITGEGNVRTSYRTAEPGGLTNLDSSPAHLSADRLRASRNAGRALYSGRARMWQGDAVIEAGSILLLREEKRLEARGGVQGLFPQSLNGKPGGELSLWRFRSATLTYWSSEGRAQLEENVSAQSAVGQIGSRAMELFFSSTRNAKGLSRALATGGVNVRQGTRRGTAEQAEYTVADEKFVLSGGTPTLFDTNRGTTTGRQLTFFLADDRILIDSADGLRTLTKHRVEK